MRLFVILWNVMSFVYIVEYQCDIEEGDLGSL
jgi:hypothetical protein